MHTPLKAHTVSIIERPIKIVEHIAIRPLSGPTIAYLPLGRGAQAETQREHAAFIVRAVNAHEAMKTALRISLSWCTCHGCGEHEIDMPDGPELRECDQCFPIRQALALAEGKEER